MKITTKNIALAITLTSALAVGASAANLIVNGDFESTVGSNVSPPGWTVFGGNPSTPSAYASYSVVPANDGIYAVDLGPSGADTENGGFLTQTIFAPSPGLYTFSFAYSNEEHHSFNFADFSFSLSGVVSDGQTFNNVGGGYVTHTSTYNIASPGLVHISFNDVIGNGHSTDAVIDSVSFQSVPEPSSALLLGLGGMGLILRRKRA